MIMELSYIKSVPTLTMVQAINDMLRELQCRNDHILDYENPEMGLDRIEYHAGDGVREVGYGDRSDNLYCFFKEV